ncbi:MAG: type II secretion system protein, partial [Gammaproteobacteria bacterium]|nr:type II secretion system protein [Gammaproteobacteria bacterium]
MRLSARKHQSGFALLIFMVVLMGIGGVLLSGFSKQSLKEVEKKRFDHNRQVLEEAKQALLMYAYNYPVIKQRGPGRLPCPDMDNNGTAESSSPCKSNTALVGRLPWDNPDLNFYDAKDADGERLWYAVSETFDYGPGTSINSDSAGTITIFDQAGNLLYDGSANGVAAVIIAPGAPVNGQDRSISNGDD